MIFDSDAVRANRAERLAFPFGLRYFGRAVMPRWHVELSFPDERESVRALLEDFSEILAAGPEICEILIRGGTVCIGYQRTKKAKVEWRQAEYLFGSDGRN